MEDLTEALESEIEKLLKQYRTRDVLICIAKIMQEYRGGNYNELYMGRVIENLMEIDF